jgi:hypothetical protein
VLLKKNMLAFLALPVALLMEPYEAMYLHVRKLLTSSTRAMLHGMNFFLIWT